MFKQAILYSISNGIPNANLELIGENLEKAAFVECGKTQDRSVGWIPPRGEAGGLLIESVGGQWILRFMSETKVVPGSAIARLVKEKAERIEQETGRKPGRKETRELKDEARLDLLPVAFTKQVSTWVWIDPVAGTIAIDTSRQTLADDVITALVESIPDIIVCLVNTKTSPQAAMAHWLADDHDHLYVDHSFIVGRECELKSADEAKATVRYGRHPLDIAEVQQHIQQGKLPTKLALTWDDRVSFVLTEGLQIKKLAFLDSVFESTKADEGGFDTDVAIATGELRKLIPDLIEALGGEAKPSEA